MNTYDYVIVGAGAAGSVLAYRLSENPSVSVALIEAGGNASSPFINMPKGLAKVLTNPAKIWAYRAEPEKGNAFRREYWTRGRLLGGSTAINGMMYVRGMPADFDEIAAKTCDDWSWQHIGPAYKALESHELGAAQTRGASGPLRLTLPNRRTALTEAMIEAGVAMGLPHKLDTNAPDSGDGIGYATRTIWKGRRQSAATAFLEPIRNRANVTVIRNALVDRVIFEGRRATSVSLLASVPREANTVVLGREIILAAGAMSSPGILQRSGIGPATLLSELGIPVLQDSPRVGRQLLEHRGIFVQWKLKISLSDNAQYRGSRLLWNLLRYYMTRSGPMSSGAYEIAASLRSHAGVKRPDVQFLIAPLSFDLAARRARLETFSGMGIVGYPLRPISHGEINIKSTDPSVLPVLKANYYAESADRALMIETVKLARRYADQEPLRRFIDVETYPGPGCVTEEAIIDAYDRCGSCAYHAVGSCAMGSNPESVVDPQLRVRGVQALRIMDTSIMPQIPSGNTSGPTMAMAWRAADIIAGGKQRM